MASKLKRLTLSAVWQLPESIREELNDRLIRSGFRDYDEHVEWLKLLGHPVARSTLARYGQKLMDEQNQLAIPVEQAKAAARAAFLTSRQWEYSRLEADVSVEALNEMGMQRWELVCSVGGFLLLKRPRIE